MTATISSAVVAHESRLVAAAELARTVGAVIALDDGTVGADANHLRAWDITATMDSDYCLVLEDDALLVAGFTEQAEAALAVAPCDIVSFYLGRSYPPRWQHRIHAALQQADQRAAHWITSTHLLHAVAVAMRTELRDDWLAWAATSKLPADERLSAWCYANDHRVAYTVPSLADHRDGPTLVQHRDRQARTQPRIAWRTGTRHEWATAAVEMA